MVRAERPRATVSVPASGSGDLGSGIEIGVVPTSRAVQSPGAGRHHGDDNGLRGNKSCCEHRPGHHVVVGSQQTITGPGNTTVCAGETTSLVGLSPFQLSSLSLSFSAAGRPSLPHAKRCSRCWFTITAPLLTRLSIQIPSPASFSNCCLNPCCFRSFSSPSLLFPYPQSPPPPPRASFSLPKTSMASPL